MTTEQRLVQNLRRAKLGLASSTDRVAVPRWAKRVIAARQALHSYIISTR